MSKRYRLKRDLPDLKAGAIFDPIKHDKFYQSGCVRYRASEMESNTYFFEEIKEPERIRITDLLHNNPIFINGKTGDSFPYNYWFCSTDSITADRLHVIKSAIEKVINGDNGDDEYCKGYEKGVKRGKEYAEIKIEQAERSSFEAARKVMSFPDHTFCQPMYFSFEDYKK